MENEINRALNLEIDISGVSEQSLQVSSLFENLEQAAADAAAGIVEAFEQIWNSLKGVGTAIGSTFDSINNTVSSFDSNIQEVEGLSQTMMKYFSILKDAPKEKGKMLSALFPKTTELTSSVGEWVSGIASAMEPVSSAFKGIGSAISGMSLGWGALVAVIVAAVIALVVLIVENWDAIKAALGAAAEWFNTNIIQPIVGFFTGLWTSITTIVSNIWNGIVSVCTGVAQWFQDNVIQPVLDFFTPVVEWFSSLFSSVGQTVSDIFYNIVVLIKGYLELVFTIWKTIGIWFYENVIKPVAEFFVGLWENISAFAASAWETIKSVFFTVAAWFDANAIQPVANFFTGLWTGFLEAAQSAWDAVKNVFSAVTGFFKDIFSKAWEGVVKVFSVAGEIFTNLKEGILGAFKKIVNGLIEGINKVVSIPFNGINGALEVVKNIKILGLTPFAGLRMISIPQIPYLAQGAVLPANKPFLAMVGDQKHGTNVEAPLATIQEAVALVMEDMVASNMAGQYVVGFLKCCFATGFQKADNLRPVGVIGEVLARRRRPEGTDKKERRRYR